MCNLEKQCNRVLPNTAQVGDGLEATSLGLPKLCLPVVWEVLPVRKGMNGSCWEAGDGSEGELGLAMRGRGWEGGAAPESGESVEVLFYTVHLLHRERCFPLAPVGSFTHDTVSPLCEAVLKPIKPV